MNDDFSTPDNKHDLAHDRIKTFTYLGAYTSLGSNYKTWVVTADRD